MTDYVNDLLLLTAAGLLGVGFVFLFLLFWLTKRTYKRVSRRRREARGRSRA